MGGASLQPQEGLALLLCIALASLPLFGTERVRWWVRMRSWPVSGEYRQPQKQSRLVGVEGRGELMLSNILFFIHVHTSNCLHSDLFCPRVHM